MSSQLPANQAADRKKLSGSVDIFGRAPLPILSSRPESRAFSHFPRFLRARDGAEGSLCAFLELSMRISTEPSYLINAVQGVGALSPSRQRVEAAQRRRYFASLASRVVCAGSPARSAAKYREREVRCPSPGGTIDPKDPPRVASARRTPRPPEPEIPCMQCISHRIPTRHTRERENKLGRHARSFRRPAPDSARCGQVPR